jgi:ubiquitin-like-conjugating enzyme ATG3
MFCVKIPFADCFHGERQSTLLDLYLILISSPGRYLFIFLKFMASVIPTIEYDYTMDFDLGSSSS